MSIMNQHVFNAFKANQNKHDSWSLFFDKFSGYNAKKEPILKDVVNCYESQKPRLQECLEQKHALFADLAKKKTMRIIYLKNRSRLLVNMGHSNVLENVGFSFERISGLPYVPGSALKGVVSNWAIWEANGNAAFEEHLPNFQTDRAVLQSNLADIFGNNEGDAEQGKINFYGIFPIQVPELKVDILTPHQGRILPNHFLTVDTGIVWAIPIALNRGDERLLDKAQKLVENCLCNYGIGAKTAAGYGKFDQVALERLAELKKHLEEKNKQQKNAVLAEKKRKEQARLKAKADREARIAEQQRRAQMAPEDLAYEDYVRSVTDWTGPAREIASKSEDEQKLILRFFRSKKGQEILADWTNPKGKKRIQNLKEAGL